MKLEDLVTKLGQIEQQAALTLDEYPHGRTVERQRLIVAIAKQVQTHLKDQMRGEPREKVARDLAPDRRLRSVDRRK